MAKYRIVDYDMAEIAALEAGFLSIEVYLCHFNGEQIWSK